MTTTTTKPREVVRLDTVMSVLANEHRRAVIRALTDSDTEELSIGELADRVIEDVQSHEEPDEDHRQQIRVALQHYHLPKLDSCGMIVHDTESQQVRDGSGDMERELLALLESYERPD